MQRIDLDNLLYHANRPENYFCLLPELEFRKVGNSYRCKQSSGLTIFQDRSGVWLIKNHSGKIDVPSGNLFKLVQHLHRLDTKTPEGFTQACKIIADVSNQILEFYNDASTPKPRHPVSMPVVKKEPYTPNAGHRSNRSYTYEFADLNGSEWEAVIDYFAKWDITPQTLTKYNVRPLKSVQHIKSKYLTKFTNQDPAFAYLPAGESSTIKFKRPYADKDNRERYIQSTGNYVFGYEQLPDDAFDTLIICAGEKDCICLNHHFNDYGVYAICFSGERATLDADFLKQLKTRCNRIYTLFDNDQTGTEMMRKHATMHGIPFIDLGFHVNKDQENEQLNDVADVLMYEGFDYLLKILNIEIGTKSAIKQQENDPFAIGVADARCIRVHQYIGEDAPHPYTGESPLQILKWMICEHSRLILTAPTGAGKTWAMIKLSLDDVFCQVAGVKYIVFAAPNTAIAEQVQKDFEKQTGNRPPIIQQGFSEFDAIDQDAERVIITTYHSLPKITAIIPDALLVIDEHHVMRDDHGYMSAENAGVFELASVAARVLMLSATPLLELTTGIIPEFNYKLCTVVQDVQQSATIQPYLYTSGAESDILNHRLSEDPATGDGVHVIKKNDVTMLEAFAQTAGPDHSAIISSKHPKYKQDSQHYQSIINTGRIDPAVNYLFCTSLLDAGTSFRFRVNSSTLINPRCINSAVQHIARARYDKESGTNENLTVHAYHSTPKSSLQSFLSDFEGTEGAYAYHSGKHTLERLKSAFERAQSNADDANAHYTDVADTSRKYFDDLDDIYYSELFGEWRPNYTRILYHEYQRQKSASTPAAFYRRMQRMHPNITVLNPIVIDLEKDAGTRDVLTERREGTAEMKALAFDLLADHTREALEVHYHKTGSRSHRQMIRAEIPVQKEMSDPAERLYRQHTELFDLDLMHLPVHRYFELNKIGLNQLPKSKIPGLIRDIQPSGTYHEFYNTLITQSELNTLKASPADLSGKAAKRARDAAGIIDQVNRLKNAAGAAIGKGCTLPVGVINYEAGTLTVNAKALKRIYQDATGRRPRKFDQVLMRFREIYQVDRQRQGKKSVYLIGRPKSIKQALESVNKNIKNE